MLDYFKNEGSDGADFPTFAGFAERIGVTLGEICPGDESGTFTVSVEVIE